MLTAKTTVATRPLLGHDRSALMIHLDDLGLAGHGRHFLSECLINDPMAPWSRGGARLVPWRVC
jgi:hypothetical protein